MPSLPSRALLDNVQALFFGRHQTGCPQNLQMLGGIGDGQIGFFSQNFDGPRPLAK
jgi:hypothetical protein